MSTISPKTRTSIRLHLIVSLATACTLCFAVGGWAATTSISGAVIAHGALVADSAIKAVQHPRGGQVREILVRENDTVEAGQVLFRLDRTEADANLQIVTKRLDEALARQARGEAEQLAMDEIRFPPELTDRADEPAVAVLMAGERARFDIRRQAREGQKSQLRARVTELERSIEGLGDQIEARNVQIDFLDKDVAALGPLAEQKLVAGNRLTDTQRQRAALQGERGQLVSSVAEARGRIAALQLEILQVDHDMREAVSRELAEIRSEIAELSERRIAAAEQRDLTEIRAPIAGTVHQLAVHTIGGVIQSGETITRIIPRDDKLVAEVRLAPKDINEVTPGQTTMLRFSGVNQQVTPELFGSVEMISGSVTEEPRTGQTYYLARVAFDAGQVRSLTHLRLMSGMPLDAFIKTRERTVLSYLAEPFKDQMTRAFREN